MAGRREILQLLRGCGYKAEEGRKNRARASKLTAASFTDALRGRRSKFTWKRQKQNSNAHFLGEALASVPHCPLKSGTELHKGQASWEGQG